jgi:hypothetical protein
MAPVPPQPGSKPFSGRKGTETSRGFIWHQEVLPRLHLPEVRRNFLGVCVRENRVCRQRWQLAFQT